MKRSSKDIMFYSTVFAAVLIFGILIYSACQRVDQQVSAAPSKPQPVVIIDVGHGGEDGGASAQDGTLEKDLNLSIAKYLNQCFLAEGFQTIMTRTEDVSVGDQNLSTVRERKRSDIRKRVELMNQTPGCVTISIHQNKFTESKYSGTQVFYSTNDKESVKLAESIKQSVVSQLQPDNKRETKPATKSIYLLENAQNTAVLVECGFLSNEEEAQKLKQPDYQKKMAFAIFLGFMEYYKAP